MVGCPSAYHKAWRFEEAGSPGRDYECGSRFRCDFHSCELARRHMNSESVGEGDWIAISQKRRTSNGTKGDGDKIAIPFPNL